MGTLAKEYPEDFHISIIRLLCAFIRNRTEDNSLKTARNHDHVQLREDVREVVTLVANRNSIQRQIERRFNFYLDLSRTTLPGADLRGAKLTGAEFFLADLSRVSFAHADLSGASLRGPQLNGVGLTGADLSGALFASPFESKAEDYWKSFHATIEDLDDPDYLDDQDSAKGLTQVQLDDAWADPENGPNLNGVRDADTGLQLKWPPIKVRSD